MSYILKQYDTDLLRFDMQKDIDGVSAHILSVNDEQKNLLPLDLELSDKGLAKWLKRRTIPSNRAYVQNFLAKLGLNEKDTKGIIEFCKGLSLNDCYWVVAEDFNGNFAENFLCRATKSEIEERCKKMLRKSAERGAYALGSGNSIARYVPLENYFTMIRVVNPEFVVG